MKKSIVPIVVLFGLMIALLLAIVAVTIARESRPRSMEIYEPPLATSFPLTVTVEEGGIITLTTGLWDVVDGTGKPVKKLWYDLGPRSNFLADLCVADKNDARCLVWVKDSPITATVSYR